MGARDVGLAHIEEEDGDEMEEGGMLMGPKHPVFRGRDRSDAESARHPGNCPPGGRFDPIHPVVPMGEPDFDELLPPGQQRPPARQPFPPKPPGKGPFDRPGAGSGGNPLSGPPFFQ